MQLVKAKQLFAGAGQDFDALREAAKQKGFKAVPLTGVKASLSFDNQIAKTMSRNVIGVLPGAKRHDEYVLYPAHWRSEERRDVKECVSTRRSRWSPDI